MPFKSMLPKALVPLGVLLLGCGVAITTIGRAHAIFPNCAASAADQAKREIQVVCRQSNAAFFRRDENGMMHRYAEDFHGQLGSAERFDKERLRSDFRSRMHNKMDVMPSHWQTTVESVQLSDQGKTAIVLLKGQTVFNERRQNQRRTSIVEDHVQTVWTKHHGVWLEQQAKTVAMTETTLPHGKTVRLL